MKLSALIIAAALSALAPVDLGLSVKWASCNLGADAPEGFGRHFAWADTEGQTWDAQSWSNGGFTEYLPYTLDDNANLIPALDAARMISGGDWRMPTTAEFRELLENCDTEWTSVNGVNGILFTSRKPGFTGRSIFLPAAGDGSGARFSRSGNFCFYWAATMHGGCYADGLVGSEYKVFAGYLNRCDGYSIRPVTEK